MHLVVEQQQICKKFMSSMPSKRRDVLVRKPESMMRFHI